MKDDEIAVIFCDADIAEMLLEKEPEIKDTLVITSVLEPGETIVVSKHEFIDWLREKEGRE